MKESRIFRTKDKSNYYILPKNKFKCYPDLWNPKNETITREHVDKFFCLGFLKNLMKYQAIELQRIPILCSELNEELIKIDELFHIIPYYINNDFLFNLDFLIKRFEELDDFPYQKEEIIQIEKLVKGQPYYKYLNF